MDLRSHGNSEQLLCPLNTLICGENYIICHLFLCIILGKKFRNAAYTDRNTMFLVFAVCVESSTEDRVDFRASDVAGAGGQDPCIVLGEYGDRQRNRSLLHRLFRRKPPQPVQPLLHVYSLHEDGHHMERWSSDLPQHVTADCWKAVTAAGDVLLQEQNSTTFLANEHRVLDSCEQEGTLIGCLTPRRAVYQLRREEEDYYTYQLIVRDKDGSLSASEQTWGGWCLSVCRDQDKIAVTEHITRTLSILSTQGN